MIIVIVVVALKGMDALHAAIHNYKEQHSAILEVNNNYYCSIDFYYYCCCYRQ